MNRYERRFAWLALITLAVMLVLMVIVIQPASADQEMVTICHAAGLDGTTQFVEITAAYPAIYGIAGHFYEDGTARAGHEDDYEGPCNSTTTTTETTTTTTPTITTVTTVPSSTTSTTSTVAASTTTTSTTSSAASSTTTQPTTPTNCAGGAKTQDCVYMPTELPYTGLNLGLVFGVAVLTFAIGTLLLRRYDGE